MMQQIVMPFPAWARTFHWVWRAWKWCLMTISLTFSRALKTVQYCRSTVTLGRLIQEPQLYAMFWVNLLMVYNRGWRFPQLLSGLMNCSTWTLQPCSRGTIGWIGCRFRLGERALFGRFACLHQAESFG